MNQQRQVLFRDPAVMTTRELRAEINEIYNIFNIDGLNQRQLSELLRQLRAGQQPVIPAPLPEPIFEELEIQEQHPPLLYNNTVMTLDQIREELLQVYGFDVNNYPDIDDNPVAIRNTLRNFRYMQHNPVGGGRKRKSKQRRTNRRRSNRK